MFIFFIILKKHQIREYLWEIKKFPTLAFLEEYKRILSNMKGL